MVRALARSRSASTYVQGTKGHCKDGTREANRNQQADKRAKKACKDAPSYWPDFPPPLRCRLAVSDSLVPGSVSKYVNKVHEGANTRLFQEDPATPILADLLITRQEKRPGPCVPEPLEHTGGRRYTKHGCSS